VERRHADLARRSVTRNPVRQSFAAGPGPAIVAVQIYWQRRMSTASPPSLRNSDDEVMQFVAANPARSAMSARRPRCLPA